MPDKFKLISPFKPAGDQPKAIESIVNGINAGMKSQVLLGITGSGKTYTMAAAIEKLNRPVLIMSPNKVLAAQLYAEFKAFFPENAVEYFISYYDYYQPEAYIPQSDTYIEKDSAINEHIDKLRLKATASLLSRRDVIVVASVSCIYNIGSPENFNRLCLYLKKGQLIGRKEIMDRLVHIRYERNELEFIPGNFRAKGNRIDVFPAYTDKGLRIELSDGAIGSIKEIHPLTGDTLRTMNETWIYPATHFVSTKEETEAAIAAIEKEMGERVAWFQEHNKPIEAERIAQRTRYDIEMMREVGYCHGIENYSRHLAGRKAGERPLCLMDYFRNRMIAPSEGQRPFSRVQSETDFLLFIDESHVAVPQVRGMYEGDRARKKVLVDFGFRLPSAIDNRPLRFDEFESLMPQTVFVSATPGLYELKLCAVPAQVSGSQVTGHQSQGRELQENSKSQYLPINPKFKIPACAEALMGRQNLKSPCIIEQIIRPTGLVDPPVTIFPTTGQLQHLMGQIEKRAKKKERTLVLALTKKTAEDLASYLAEKGLRARYIHSDIETLERLEILKELRKGSFDALIGINLLREGLDLPEVSLVAILDADNEGFLRSETTLIQIAGRAARNVGGEVFLYADRITGSMKRAMDEMQRRRIRQEEYNRINKITPKTIQKATHDLEEFEYKAKKEGLALLHDAPGSRVSPKNLPRLMKEIEKQMKDAADNLNFELAAELRDRLFELKEMKAQHKKTSEKFK